MGELLQKLDLELKNKNKHSSGESLLEKNDDPK